MILALEILGAWCALAIIAAPILIPFYVRRLARHDDWVEQTRLRPH